MMPTLERAKSDFASDPENPDNGSVHTNATVIPDPLDDTGNKPSNSEAASLAASVADTRTSVPKSDSHSSNAGGFEGQLDPLRFRSIFLQTVEELRMRRGIDTENDSRIKELITDNHELQKKLEEEKALNVSLVDEHSQTVQNLRLDYEEKMKHAQNEKTKIHITAENWDCELQALKDEIRALHLVKYNLEKKVTEQERQLHLQVSYRDTYLSQMNELDQKCTAVLKQADDISEQIEKLEANVRCSKDLHLKLQYVNEHQKCELDVCKGKLEACQAELMEARVKGTEKQLSDCSSNDGLTIKTKAVDQELKMQTELNKQLQEQLSSLRNEYQDVLRQLKDSHLLIEKHAQSLTTATTSEETLQKEVTSLTERVGQLSNDLDSSRKGQQTLEEKLSRDNDLWSLKHKDIESRLKSLQEDYTTLQETHERDSESKLAKLKDAELSISRLEEEVACLRAQQSRLQLEPSTSQKESMDTTSNDDKVADTASNEPAQAVGSQDQNSTSEQSDSTSSVTENTSKVEPQSTESAGHSPEVIAGSQNTDTNRSQSISAQQVTEEVLTSSQVQNKFSPQLSPRICLEKLRIPVAAEGPLAMNKTGCKSTEVLTTAECQVVESIQDNEPKTAKLSQEPVKRQATEDVEVECPSLKKQRLDGQSSSQQTTEDACIPDTSSAAPVSILPTTQDTAEVESIATDVSHNSPTSEPKPLKAEVDQPSDNNNPVNVAAPCGSITNDQPTQPGGLAIVFSDEDDLSNEEDRLLNTQFNKQIDKVQMFLKLDRLRRPKNSA